MVFSGLTLFVGHRPGAAALMLPMPRYYVHLSCPEGRLEDGEGAALPDPEAAWYHAVRSARTRLGEEEGRAQRWAQGSIEIVDECGLPVNRIPMIEIVRFEGGAI